MISDSCLGFEISNRFQMLIRMKNIFGWFPHKLSSCQRSIVNWAVDNR